jgi:hypothetical protein
MPVGTVYVPVAVFVVQVFALVVVQVGAKPAPELVNTCPDVPSEIAPNAPALLYCTCPVEPAGDVEGAITQLGAAAPFDCNKYPLVPAVSI